jgi:hypothetical protein
MLRGAENHAGPTGLDLVGREWSYNATLLATEAGALGLRPVLLRIKECRRRLQRRVSVSLPIILADGQSCAFAFL